MAVAVRPTRRPPTALPAPLARSGVAAAPFLTGIVAASFALRVLFGWLRATPVYLGDEYLYSELGRSLAESGRPLVRGEAADFPALLQPLLTAPAWLFGEVGTSYHLVQTMGALAMSLAALPVYWLARRLGLRAGLALVLAALAVALPDLVYASWMVAEPFAYPLALAAVAAATAALARPSARGQLGFVALAALAAFARIQFVVLPVCFLGALVVVGLRERRLRTAVREQALALALLALPVAVALALGPARVLAFYGGVVDVHVDPVALVHRSGSNLFILLYASGFVLVPGAILGLALALARPRSRAELAFGALTVMLTLGLLVEAGLFGAVDQVQERYVFYVLPAATIAFGLYASRGWPARRAHALIAAALVTLSAVVPLAGFAAADEKAHSPLLYAAFRIEQWLGTPGNGSLAIAVVAAACMGLLALATLRPRVATVAGVALAFLLCAGLSTATVLFDQENTRAVRNSFLPADRSWIDHARLGDVTLLRNIGGVRGAAFQQLFWNRSVKRLLLMPGAPEIDPFPAPRVSVADDGSLFANGASVSGALLVDEHAVTTRLTGVRQVATGPGFTLYAPAGRPRLALFFLARYDDGWLGERGTIDLWPRQGSERLEGQLVLELESPAPLGPATVDFRLPGGRELHARVPARSRTTVTLPVCSHGPWTAGFRSKIRGFLGDRAVSVKGSVPRFVPGHGGCHARPQSAPAAPTEIV